MDWRRAGHCDCIALCCRSCVNYISLVCTPCAFIHRRDCVLTLLLFLLRRNGSSRRSKLVILLRLLVNSSCFCFDIYDGLLLLVVPRRASVTYLEKVVVELVVACLCSGLHKARVELHSFLVASYPCSIVSCLHWTCQVSRQSLLSRRWRCNL